MTVIFLRDNQDIPRTAFPFYYKVFILAPSRTVDSTVTVLRSHWCSPELGLYFKSIKLAVNGALSVTQNCVSVNYIFFNDMTYHDSEVGATKVALLIQFKLP